mmetsp:Transcript_38922/g.70225  ORF Transcript_38922/g.70225 Transcript_38922/m.70225 type:complete len:298 (+) Transcript_38922:50-943(+)|eukprot:CAMPEP_0197664724 /NCGR_PEP_ID=MMETSP1338-20131121/58811_1 /TAXON_ID=43686 ORGANISM="Pelagodinium beii, Strain RCC1491" /NCGR_SAMPLE_ID=MMETSP1338 /ASSEMBLY_ACC=CAM_ASM_000754 /LENGTH=297 /DNA_ID=CAMNT_0043243423 /DNA_START=39 /DNA_END=932 /DNA_ORIENTATION=-
MKLLRNDRKVLSMTAASVIAVMALPVQRPHLVQVTARVLPVPPVPQTVSKQRHARAEADSVPEMFQGNDVCRLVYAAKEGIGSCEHSMTPGSPGSEGSDRFLFSVYDVGKVLPEEWHKKWRPANTREVDGIWHSSLKAYGHTYDNPRHVDGTLPKVLAEDMRYQYELTTTRSYEEFDKFFKEISATGDWNMDQYDVRYRNCNHFIVECVKYLVGPSQANQVVASPEFLSPMDFDKKEPPPELGQEFNEAVLKGMMRRQRAMRRRAKLMQAATASRGNAMVGVLAVASFGFMAALSLH